MIVPSLKKTLAVAAAISMTFFAAACGGGAGSTDGSVKVGVIQPLSGALAAYGEESQAGFEYIVDKINESGGIESMDGATIEVVGADGASDPGKVATEARRLAGQEDVPLIVGSLLTSQMAAISPVADQFQVPVLSMFAGGTNSEYLYTLGLPYKDGYGGTMSKFVDQLNQEYGASIKTAALASSNYEAGQQVDDGLQELLPELGIDVVGTVPLETAGNDYKPAVTKLNALNPDVVMGLVTTEDGVTLHQARAATNSQLLFVGGTGGYADPHVWESLGDGTAKKVLAKSTFAMSSFSTSAKQEHLQDFLAEVNDADLGVPIGQNFVQGAQAAWVVKELLEAAGDATSEAIYEAFSGVDIPADSDKLYLPKTEGLRFDAETRFMTDVTALIVEWNEDGTQDVVFPKEFATREPSMNK